MITEIRTATPDDLPSLRDVFRSASLANEADRDDLLAHPELLEFAGEGIAEGRTRVAVLDSGVVGFSTVVPSDGFLELDDLFVHPDWMRRGIGAALVRDVADRARAAGVPRVEVTGNDHAIAFYEAAGFVPGGLVRTMFGTARRLHLDLAGPA